MSKSAIFVVSGFLAFLLYALLLYGLLLERHNKEAEKILLDLGKKNEQVIDLNLEDLPSDEKKDEKVVEKNATDKEGDFIDPKEQEESLEDIFSSLNDFQEKTDTNAQKDEQKNEQEEEQRRLKEQQRLRKTKKSRDVERFATEFGSIRAKTRKR